MDEDSDYATLAEQAERLGTEALDGHIAASWGSIAGGFRQLARLHSATKRVWMVRNSKLEKSES